MCTFKDMPDSDSKQLADTITANSSPYFMREATDKGFGKLLPWNESNKLIREAKDRLKQDSY